MARTYEQYLENATGTAYTAEYEIAWLEQLPADQRRAQIQLILWDCRRYDSSVDMGKLRSECIRLWGEL